MSSNDKCTNENFGDSSQLTNWILYSGATCHMTPEVSNFISGLLEDTDKRIEVADRHHITAKHKGQVQNQMCGDHGDPFIATLHKVILAPYLCDKLFSIITIIKYRRTRLLQIEF